MSKQNQDIKYNNRSDHAELACTEQKDYAHDSVSYFKS